MSEKLGVSSTSSEDVKNEVVPLLYISVSGLVYKNSWGVEQLDEGSAPRVPESPKL